MKKLLLASALSATLIVSATSPHVNQVFDFLPAPGQFNNTMPVCNAGEPTDSVINRLNRNAANGFSSMITLGGYGGYIVVGFDHTIVNVPGEYDFKVKGNAFYSGTTPDPTNGLMKSSAEPGIVMVSRDLNGNGLPDDPWYELAGSDYNYPTTIKNYEITYHRPLTEPTGNVAEYIRWTDNQGATGWFPKNSFHNQTYYPRWVTADSITFRGTKMASNSVMNGAFATLYSLAWGYADNHPNNNDLSNFNIEWAVDDEGNSVQLRGIDFVKVYTGIYAINGMTGELSTEFQGVEDLHPNEIINNTATAELAGVSYLNPMSESLYIVSPETARLQLFSLWGQALLSAELSAGENNIAVGELPKGVYVARISAGRAQTTIRLVKR